jgi:hypothetical protein
MKAFKTYFKTTVGTKPQSEAGGSAKVAEVLPIAGGQEKKAYDYAHEVREKEQHHDAHSKATPLDPDTEAAKGRKGGRWIGGINGGILGGVLGGMGGSGKHMALGALAGAGLGAWAGHHMGHHAGLAAATESKLGIEHSKHIMAMPPDERKDYFQHLARNDEISAREADEWDRHNDREMNAEWRHQESMDSHHRAHGGGHY